MTTRLDRFMRNVAIVDKNGSPTMQEQAREQRNLEAIEAALNSLQDQLNLIQAAQDAADAANTAAAAAQTAADNADTAAAAAQTAAEDAITVAAITASGVTGATITATDAGTDATVSISAHTRVYGDGTNVSVSAGTILAQPYSTLLYIYYDQPSRLGGAVTYVATTSQTTAAQTGDRHLVGQVLTPAALGAPIDGDYVGAPGLGGIYQ